MSMLLLEPEHSIMQTRQFTNLKRRIEGFAMATLATVPAAEVAVAAGGPHQAQGMAAAATPISLEAPAVGRLGDRLRDRARDGATVGVGVPEFGR